MKHGGRLIFLEEAFAMTPARYEVMALRRRIAVTQVVLAQLLDVHSMTVSQWERGALEPTPYKLAMMRAFACAPEIVRRGLEVIIAKQGVVAAVALLLSTPPIPSAEQ